MLYIMKILEGYNLTQDDALDDLTYHRIVEVLSPCTLSPFFCILTTVRKV